MDESSLSTLGHDQLHWGLSAPLVQKTDRRTDPFLGGSPKEPQNLTDPRSIVTKLLRPRGNLKLSLSLSWAYNTSSPFLPDLNISVPKWKFVPVGNLQSFLHKVIVDSRQISVLLPFLAHLFWRLSLDILWWNERNKLFETNLGMHGWFILVQTSQRIKLLHQVWLCWFQLTMSVLSVFATNSLVMIVNRCPPRGSELHIYIVCKMPHHVQLDVDSVSNRFNFLIISLAFYNQVSYHVVTIRVISRFRASWALFFSGF